MQDWDACYRVVKGRDRRFDGVFYTAVRTTGIYCRPSCPAITPAAAATSRSSAPPRAPRAPATAPAAAACPTRRPGSPEWDVAADVASRAMRLVADGVVEREGVDGLARALGLLHPPAQPRGHPAVRRRTAGAGPVAPRPDGARADRDDRPVLRRHGVRRRLRQRPPVQRHRPRGVRRDARPTCAAGPRRDAIAGPSGTIRTRIAVREPFAGRRAAPLPRRACRARASRPPVPGGTSARSGFPHGPGRRAASSSADRTPG